MSTDITPTERANTASFAPDCAARTDAKVALDTAALILANVRAHPNESTRRNQQ